MIVIIAIATDDIIPIRYQFLILVQICIKFLYLQWNYAQKKNKQTNLAMIYWKYKLAQTLLNRTSTWLLRKNSYDENIFVYALVILLYVGVMLVYTENNAVHMVAREQTSHACNLCVT